MEAWVTDARVDTLLHSGNRVYLGGEFERIGPFTGGGVDLPANPTNASPAPNPAFPRVHGGVFAVAPDGAGGWYIGGFFERVGGVARQNLAHILADGSVDPAWDPAANGSVHALVVDGDSVFAGGGFSQVDGLNRQRLVKLGADDGAVDPTFVSQVTVSDEDVHGQPFVHALALETAAPGGHLFVGGNFDTVKGTAGKVDLAKVNLSNGNVNTGFDADTAPNTSGETDASAVQALAAAGTTLHVGGFFDSLDGLARANLAAVEQGDGDALPGFQANTDSDVRDLALDGTELFVAGSFDTVTDSVGDKAREGLAKVAASSGAVATHWVVNADQQVQDIEVSGGTLYAAGTFSAVSSVERLRLAAVPTVDNMLGVVPSAWNPAVNGPVYALAHQGGRVYAGGEFTSVGGLARNGLAAVDAAAGTAIESFDAEIDTEGAGVRSLALSGGRLYVAGNFSTNGQENLAAVDPTSGALDPAFDPQIDDNVIAVAVSNGMVFAGGQFTTPHASLAAFEADGDAVPLWQADIGSGFVTDLLASGDLLYVAGSFDTIDGDTSKSNLAALTAATGNLASWGPAGNPSSEVAALALGFGRLYVTGAFSQIGGVSQRAAAALDPGTGSLLPWNPGITSGFGEAVTLSSSGVYIGGGVGEVAGQQRTNLVALAPDTAALGAWHPRPTPFFVLALAAGSGRLWAGGSFQGVGGETREHFAAFPFNVPANTAAPHVSSGPAGFACTTGTWANDPVSFDFQWLRNGEPIAGATGTSYAASPSDGNTDIACRVTATNEAGSASATSAAITVPGPPAGGGANPAARDSVVANMSIGSTLTLTARGVLELTLGCSRLETRCTGNVVVTTARAIEVSARRRVRLGRKSFRIAGGRRAKVRFRLSRRNRAILRRQRTLPRLRLTVNARDAAGNTRRYTKRARIRVQRPRRR